MTWINYAFTCIFWRSLKQTWIGYLRIELLNLDIVPGNYLKFLLSLGWTDTWVLEVSSAFRFVRHKYLLFRCLSDFQKILGVYLRGSVGRKSPNVSVAQ